MLAASTDAIRTTAKGILTPEANPKLFKTARGTFSSEENVQSMVNNPVKTLEHELGEAEETWKSVLDFISYYQRDGRATAIEGVAVLPQELIKVSFEYEAVFIVNLSDQTNTILKHAQNNPDDWLQKYDEPTIRAFCKFNLYWNQFYANEAEKYGFSVIEVSDDFSASIDKAVDLLLGLTNK